MKDNLLKRLVKNIFFSNNSTHRIVIGPMRGIIFRTNNITGLQPLYSGFERKHQKTFKKFLKKGSVAIDVGANWGCHTVYLSKLVGATGKVIAIEPYRPAFEELRWHIKKNECDNVVLLPFALSNVEGVAEFIPLGTNQGQIYSSGSEKILSREHITTVTTKTIDAIVESFALATVDLVKIDVEGAEDKVLLGAEKTTKRYRPYFIIDSHSPENDVFMGKWFIERKYKLQRLYGPPILRTDIGWPNKNGVWGSILAIP